MNPAPRISRPEGELLRLVASLGNDLDPDGVLRRGLEIVEHAYGAVASLALLADTSANVARRGPRVGQFRGLTPNGLRAAMALPDFSALVETAGLRQTPPRD